MLTRCCSGSPAPRCRRCDGRVQGIGGERSASVAIMGWATPEKPIPAGIAGHPRCRLTERWSVMPELPQYRMFIGGEWLAAKSGEWFESYDPYAGKPWALVARGGP